ncbi:MAG: hypothetical protein PSX81_14270 [bacterium]|nr:hypothetical protein [bacterium]
MANKKLLLILEMTHIPLWLIKDLCWLLTWKTLGVIMAIPTVSVAIALTIFTQKDEARFLPNLSIAFWIIANANWMIAEFFNLPLRYFSIIPFIAGIIVFLFYLYNSYKKGWEIN